MVRNAAGKTVLTNDLFFPLALIYLAAPNLIFLAAWVRPWIGIPATILVVICSVFLVWQNRSGQPRQVLGRTNRMFVLALAFYWTLLAGAGGFVPQEFDYIKHNLVFHDLIHFDWPVNYPLPDRDKSYLCYGLGYYLVPALGGRILGDAAMPVLTFLWTFAGIALFFYWVATFTKTPKASLLIFLLFAATNLVLLALKHTRVPGQMDAFHVRSILQQLGLYHSYYDFFTKLQFQPQHGLVAMLGMALLYEMVWTKKDPRGAVFTWSVCLLWSPMTCLGLLLVPLAALRRVPWRPYFSWLNLVGGGILLAIMGVYFQGHVALLDRGFVWNLAPCREWLVFYFLFVVAELSPVLLLFLIDQRYRVLGEFRPLFLLATGFLLLLPLCKFGYCGDLRLQAGTPALILGALGAITCLRSELFPFKRPLFVLFTGSLLVGAAYPIFRPWWNLKTNQEDYSYVYTTQIRGFRTLAEYKEPGWNVAAQYLGRPDSVAAHWLLRKNTGI